MLLAVTSAVILWSESRWTHHPILLSEIRDSTNLEGQVPVFTFPRNRVPYSSSPIASGLWWGYANPWFLSQLYSLRTDHIDDNQSQRQCQVKVKVTLRLTVSQSVSLFVEPHLWGALSDERTGLSFIYAAGPRQRSLSRVRVPWDS
jgi:hypothetical protein